MNLLIFIHSLHSGGAERVTANLANYWAEKGWQITIVTLTDTAGDFYQLHPAVTRIGLGVSGESSNPLAAMANNLRRVIALRRILRQVRPQVALAMMTTANVLLALAALRIKNIVTVGSEHTYPPRIPLGSIWEALRSRCYGLLDAVTGLTSESATWLRQHTNAKHIAVIPNAAPWPLAQQPPFLSLPDLAQSQRILLAVGRLAPEKNFDLLIDVFKRLANDFLQWQLIILGEGAERQALQAQIENLGLSGRVFLMGNAGNIGQWYSAADLYVMSSRFEGFPNTLAEAMAHGLPAISFDCDTGPRDIIRHELDGLLIPAEDITAMEAGLRRLMGDDDLRQQFAAKAVEARERFSLERVAGMWEQLFSEYLNSV